LGGVGGVATSCKASIGIAVLQFGDFAWFQDVGRIEVIVGRFFKHQGHHVLKFPSTDIEGGGTPLTISSRDVHLVTLVRGE